MRTTAGSTAYFPFTCRAIDDGGFIVHGIISLMDCS